ncbi:hypothetical protein A9Q99_08725 [Gammaproteobacteria bacterium 45_16_T64]|nr:hypothetical protein A9Q99_08725 [Gammaproteobacteria bacterium 45_16_T64]
MMCDGFVLMKHDDNNRSTSPPKLYIWKDSRLFLGTKSIVFRNYTLAWDQLLVCMQGEMLIRKSNDKKVTSRTCLIRAGTIVDNQDINTTNAIVTIYYLNPISQDYCVLENSMKKATKSICYSHVKQDQIITQMHYISDSNATPKLAHAILIDTLELSIQPKNKKEYDPRIVKLVRMIRETVADNLSIHEYAESVHLSPSRLAKLFKQQMGIPITKYRLQIRVSYGVIHLAAGRSSTEAAYLSGFSSSGHFSTCFSDMIGVQPSSTFLTPPYVKAFIAEDVLEALPNLA